MIGRYSHLGVYHELAKSSEFAKVVLAGVLALVSYLMQGLPSHQVRFSTVAALLSLALTGLPIVWGAAQGIIQRRVNVDELVSLAIIASVIRGEYLTGAVVGFIMMLGSLVEQATADSARRAIQALISISPQTASRVLADGQTETVPIPAIHVGDILLVRPGERLPVDATIINGITAVDESSMTGEPMPVHKGVGDVVYAGALNQNGVIEIKVTRTGEDTTLGRIIKIVSEAEGHKPLAVRTIDRYAMWFTPIILICAAAAWLLTGDVNRTVAVLIVGCPCALILAAPTAIVATIGRAAKAGILIKGGLYLEEMGRADTVFFDKTATLTEGKPRVDAIVSIDGVAPDDVLARAACVERNSTHPLARAVLRAAYYAKITIACAEQMFTEIGLGVRAIVDQRLVEVGSAYLGGGTVNLPTALREHLEVFKTGGKTPLVVYENRQPIGIISVADHIRSSAGGVLEELRSLGIQQIGIVSGDHRQSVQMIADSLGVNNTWAELKPEDKIKPVVEFQERGNTVVFIGDGINDAPALAVANVGIAMGAVGTDVALETADIVLMNDDLAKVPFLIQLSRRMLTVIKWNIAFGMSFNALAVIAGGAGLLTPIMGAVVHNLGSILVVLSSASMVFVAERPAARPENPSCPS